MLKDLKDTLVCPFGTEEEPVQDLSMLSCGHFVSLHAWQTYESVNPGITYHCPSCHVPVQSISKPWPVGKIGDIVRRIREECQGLNDLLDWNQGIAPSISAEIMSTSDHSQIHIASSYISNEPPPPTGSNSVGSPTNPSTNGF